MKFDKNKAHGQIWGDDTRGARFVQNGRYYDNDGNEVDMTAGVAATLDSPATFVPPAAPAPSAPATTAAEDAVAAAASAQAVIEARRGQLLLLAIPALENTAEKIIAELEDHDIELLQAMGMVETLSKKRKTVLEALAAAIADKEAQAQKDAQANGLAPQTPQAPAADTVNLPKGTFGTMSGENQLAQQLQS